MAETDYERRTSERDLDRYVDRYEANSWGMVIGIAAVIAIVAMLFIGFGASGPDRTQNPTAVERTTPAPTPTAPTTQPAPPATAPNPN